MRQKKHVELLITAVRRFDAETMLVDANLVASLACRHVVEDRMEWSGIYPSTAAPLVKAAYQVRCTLI